MLASERRTFEKLQTLDRESIENVKEAFMKYNHPRFMRAFSYHLPFGVKKPTEKK
jgi:hypothetical protein